MESVLKLTLLLYCMQRGEGHWLTSMLESHGRAESPQSGGVLEESDREQAGQPLAGRIRRRAESPCGLHMLLLQVSTLGLGYDSDEMVLFKYCSGDCPQARSNHDLTLTNLLLQGALPPPLPPGPCCRPTHHEDLAFLDNTHRWHKVEKLSAAACSCVG